MTRTAQPALAALRARRRELAAAIAEIGFTAPGTVLQVRTVCGTRLRLPHRPRQEARTLLAAHPQGQQQDSDPAADPSPGRPVHRVDRQRPQAT